MKNKKKLTFISVISSVCLVVIVLLVMSFLMSQTSTSPLPNRAANDLSEFSAYDKYKIDDYTIKDDVAIKGLSYTDSRVFAVMYNKNIYFVYAYMFDSIDTARTYYNRHGYSAGQQSHGGKLKQGIGLFGVSDAVYVSFYKNFAYKVCGRSSREISNLLNECSSQFSVDLQSLKKSGGD